MSAGAYLAEIAEINQPYGIDVFPAHMWCRGPIMRATHRYFSNILRVVPACKTRVVQLLEFHIAFSFNFLVCCGEHWYTRIT